MNIFLIVRGFPTDTDPQWGSFEYDQAKALVGIGHKVTLLSIDARRKSFRRKIGIHVNYRDGITSYDLNSGPLIAISLFSNQLYDYVRDSLMLWLFKYVIKKEGMPDLLYSHYLNNTSCGLAIKKKYRIPLVGLEHWSEMGKSQPIKYALYKAKNVYPNLDKLLVVSNSLRNNILRLCNIDSIVIPNIIGDEFRYEEKLNTKNVVKFISTGNLIPIKRMDLVIIAFASICKIHDNCYLTIVGDGPDMNKLQNAVEELGMAKRIKLVGRKTREAIVSLLNDSDIYVLASSSETFGVAAAEALACGIPVISTNCGGPCDFVTKDNGVIVPVDCVKSLEEAMGYMIENYHSYSRRLISEDFRLRFSAQGIANQLTDIFNKVCS